MLTSLENFGTPRGPLGTPREPTGSTSGPERVSEEVNDIRHIGYQFHPVFGTEKNTRSPNLKQIISGAQGVSHGCPGLYGGL